jgi:hypothetical protein
LLLCPSASSFAPSALLSISSKGIRLLAKGLPKGKKPHNNTTKGLKMKKLVINTAACLLIATSSTNAGMIEINLNQQDGKRLNKNHICEWRIMNEDGNPVKGNPFYGSSWKRELPVGRYVFTTNCGAEGSGSLQILSTTKKEDYTINLFKFVLIPSKQGND